MGSSKFLKIATVVSLVVVSSITPSLSSSATQSCLTAPTLSTRQVSTKLLANNKLRLTSYKFPSYSANSSGFQSLVEVVKGSVANIKLEPSFLKVGQDSHQTDLASKEAALIHVNGDRFSYTTNFPNGAFGRNSHIDFAKFGYTKVVGVSVTAKSKLISFDSVRAKGAIKNSAGTTLAQINAVNYSNDREGNTTVLYTSDWSGATPFGGSSIIVNSANKVIRIIDAPDDLAVPTGTKMIKFFGTLGNSYTKFKVGQTLKIADAWDSVLNHNYQQVFGVSSQILRANTNVATCDDLSETIRPRTVLGWNSSGTFWLMTTSMGVNYADGGYRMGGSSIHQAADWLKQLGATEAVAMDGGGSTEMLERNGTGYKRLDIDDPYNQAWSRNIPQGISLVLR